MNKRGGFLAYAFWICIGIAIGIWFAKTFLC